MANKKVLVTGADGFIGSHLTQQLIREGYDVQLSVLTTLLAHGAGLIHSQKKKKMP